MITQNNIDDEINTSNNIDKDEEEQLLTKTAVI